jgi:hypothetical protein
MKKALAVVLVLVGVPVTVLLVCFLTVFVFKVDADPGKNPGMLFGMIVPGVAVFALARKLWTAGNEPKPSEDEGDGDEDSVDD